MVEDARLVYSLSLPSANLKFAGGLRGQPILADVDYPKQLLSVNGNRLDTIHLDISLSPDIKIGEVVIDSPYFYLGDLLNYEVYRGDINTWSLTDTIHRHNFFSEFQPSNDSVLILRTFSGDRSTFRLQKEIHGEVMSTDGVLEKQVDGLFCTDGMLRRDPVTGRIVYVYFYRNNFICMSSQMNIEYLGQTIDTTSVAKIRVAKNKEHGYSTLSSPPFVVNRAANCYDGKLFVNSKLKADNEQKGEFAVHDVIDVYDLITGYYSGSFYIPYAEGKRLRHFVVRGKRVHVLSEKKYLVYQLPNSL